MNTVNNNPSAAAREASESEHSLGRFLPAGLRPLTTEDAPRCAQLEQTLFGDDDPWSEQAFYYEFAGRNVYVGYDADGVLVGYGGLAMLGPESDPEFEVHTIGVDPRYRRQGIGRLIMQMFTDIADHYNGPIFLECRTDNEAAVSLYRDFGFVVIAERANYYQPSGADAYVMQRNPHGVTEQQAADNSPEK